MFHTVLHTNFNLLSETFKLKIKQIPSFITIYNFSHGTKVQEKNVTETMMITEIKWTIKTVQIWAFPFLGKFWELSMQWHKKQLIINTIYFLLGIKTFQEWKFLSHAKLLR